MKIRGGRKTEKIEPQMAPMIDIVFLLLIFFMLTLKIVEPEGDFSINMPIGKSVPTDQDPAPPPLNVRMTSDPRTGWLVSLKVGNTELFANTSAPGVADAAEAQAARAKKAFEELNRMVLEHINSIGGLDSPQMKKQEVEIDGDFELNSRYLIKAIGACRGAMRRNTDGTYHMVDYITNIKFAPPHKPRT